VDKSAQAYNKIMDGDWPRGPVRAAHDRTDRAGSRATRQGYIWIDAYTDARGAAGGSEGPLSDTAAGTTTTSSLSSSSPGTPDVEQALRRAGVPSRVLSRSHLGCSCGLRTA
jgi:hypothetical protein